MASPLVYLLMERSLWLPIYLGLGCLVVATIGPVFLPETLSRRPRSQAPESRQPPVSWLKAVRQETKKLGEAMRWLTWGNWKVAVLLCTFLLTTLGRFAQEILLQYVTRRYQWSWSKVRVQHLRRFQSAVKAKPILIGEPFALHPSLPQPRPPRHHRPLGQLRPGPPEAVLGAALQPALGLGQRHASSSGCLHDRSSRNLHRHGVRPDRLRAGRGLQLPRPQPAGVPRRAAAAPCGHI